MIVGSMMELIFLFFQKIVTVNLAGSVMHHFLSQVIYIIFKILSIVDIIFYW